MAVGIVESGYTQKELEKDLLAGYQYVNLSCIPPKEEKLLPLLPTATFMPISGGFSSEDPERLSINNEEIRAFSPTIPTRFIPIYPTF